MGLQRKHGTGRSRRTGHSKVSCPGAEPKMHAEGKSRSCFLGFRPSTSSDSEALEGLRFVMPVSDCLSIFLWPSVEAREHTDSSREILSGNQQQREQRAPRRLQEPRSQNPLSTAMSVCACERERYCTLTEQLRVTSSWNQDTTEELEMLANPSQRTSSLTTAVTVPPFGALVGWNELFRQRP